MFVQFYAYMYGYRWIRRTQVSRQINKSWENITRCPRSTSASTQTVASSPSLIAREFRAFTRHTPSVSWWTTWHTSEDPRPNPLRSRDTCTTSNYQILIGTRNVLFRDRSHEDLPRLFQRRRCYYNIRACDVHGEKKDDVLIQSNGTLGRSPSIFWCYALEFTEGYRSRRPKPAEKILMITRSCLNQLIRRFTLLRFSKANK